jgi:calcineurin-like phosphoesterase family protein
MEYVISDTHFSHANIIKYCQRPFHNIEEMNAHMIRKWNNRVKPNDIVYHLGDVGYLKGSQSKIDEPSQIQKIIQDLPGTKILIRGNHDKSPGVMYDVGFDMVCESMVVRVPNMNDCYVYLNHRPLGIKPQLSDPNHPGIDFVIHGHIHNSTEEERRKHINKGEMSHIPDYNINVSVEVINYEPQALEHVVRRHIAQLQRHD